MLNGSTDKVRQDMEQLSAPDALADIFRIIQRANKYIDETEPWVLNKQGEKAKLATVMHTLCECIKFAATLLKPFIPDTADRIFQKLGLPSAENFDGLTFGGIGEGVRVNKGENLFNRIDVEKELKELEKYAEEKKRPAAGRTDRRVRLCQGEALHGGSDGVPPRGQQRQAAAAHSKNRRGNAQGGKRNCALLHSGTACGQDGDTCKKP